MKKLIFSLFVMLIATTRLSASNTQVDGIWYDFDSSTKTASVTYRGMTYLSYKDEYTDSVIIPETVTYNSTTYSVTTIGARAFCGCSGLTSVTIPNSVTTIGTAAFNCCSGLTSITIPNSVTTIGDYAFVDCIGLTSVTIPNSVTTIGSEAFYRCSGLTSIAIPNSVTTIGDMAFYGCNSLTSVTIGNSVTTIGERIFEYCNGLASVIVESGNAVYDNRGNCNAIIETSTNTLILGCKNTIIPNSVTTIGGSAFWRCSSLNSITIPNSVTTIGNCAFYDCSGLTSVTIGNSVTTIGDGAFQQCTGLTSVTIPNSVTTIRERTFAYCTGLTSVTIGNSVTSIGDWVFGYCSDLTSITCYALTPPECRYHAFSNILQDAKVYVPASALVDYQNAEVWKDMQLYPIAAEVTPMDDENPIVTPSDQDVTITWPITDGTDTYTLTITKNGETVCVLTFNANGQLTNIAFAAPGHNGAHQAPAATLTAQGYQFTVTGLNPGTAYNYSVTATDASGKTLAEHKGNFSTTGETGLNALPYEGKERIGSKYFHNGNLIIERNGIKYTATGQKVR